MFYPRNPSTLKSNYPSKFDTKKLSITKSLSKRIFIFCIVVICYFQIYFSLHIASRKKEDSNGHLDQHNVHQPNITSPQRFVILAGPHKTGSSSVQHNIMHWTSVENMISQNWVWPVPSLVTEIESNDKNNWEWTNAKGFYALVESLRNPAYTITSRLLFRRLSLVQLQREYRTTFLKTWIEGKNIVIGSEAFDHCVKDFDGERIVDDIVNLMPWSQDKFYDIPGNINDATVVVMYRSPRVNHLISMWHEFHTNFKKQSFYSWLEKTTNNFGALDSLGLAEIFLNGGFKVTLIDVGGVLKKGYDTSNVVACDVLNVPCTSKKEIIGLKEKPVTKNVKSTKNFWLNVTDEQLMEMESILIRYDCNFRHIFVLQRLTVLHSEALTKNLKECEKYEGKKRISRAEVKKKIRNLALGIIEDGEEEEMDENKISGLRYYYYYSAEDIKTVPPTPSPTIG